MPVMDTKANAIMGTSSFDRLSSQQQVVPGSSQGIITSLTQPYNNFRVQTQGGNIIQGAVNRLRVGEIFFPYDIPTVVAGSNANIFFVFNGVTLSVGGTVATWVQAVLNLNIRTDYFTAGEMQLQLQGAIQTFEAANGIPAGTLLVDLDVKTQSLYFTNTNVWNGADGQQNWLIIPSAFGFGGNASEISKTLQKPNLAWTLGFRQLFANAPPIPPTYTGTVSFWYNTVLGTVRPQSIVLVPDGYPNVGPSNLLPIFAPGYAPTQIFGSTYNGRYTDYIDICSPTLCQAQFVRDGNTNQQVIRRDQICRLWIADEISVFDLDPVGTRPFIIHRQFKNPKIIKWTAERSIDAIDIQLYDMYGQLLPIPTVVTTPPTVFTAPSYALSNGPRDFGITFLVEEQEVELVTDRENIGYRM